MEIKTKVVRRGNSFAMLIPKALIDCKILNQQTNYIIMVKEDVPPGNVKKKQRLPPDSDWRSVAKISISYMINAELPEQKSLLYSLAMCQEMREAIA